MIPFGRVYLRLAVMRYYAAYNLRFSSIACRHFSEHKITREGNAFWNMRKNKLKPIESLALMDVKVSATFACRISQRRSVHGLWITLFFGVDLGLFCLCAGVCIMVFYIGAAVDNFLKMPVAR